MIRFRQSRKPTRRFLLLAAAVLCASACLSAVAAAELQPAGPEFRISTSGADADASRRAGEPTVVFNSSANEYLVIWEADSFADDEFEIFGQRLSAAGAEIGTEFRISTTGVDRDAFEPAIAFNPSANEYLVTWQADGLATDNEFEIFGQRLSATGAALGAAFRISTTRADGDVNRVAFEPTVAFNPSANEYLVTWVADGFATNDEFEIFGQRLSATGAELGADFRISTTGADGDESRGASNPTVIHNSSANEYLLIWQADGLATDNHFEILGQRLSATGAKLGPDFPISNSAGDRRGFEPAIAFNSSANEYLATWGGDPLPTDGEFDAEIFAQRLSATGAKLGPDFPISNSAEEGAAFEPAIAYNPGADEYLATWEADGIAVRGKSEIFGQRLSATGAELGADFRISTTGADTDASRGAREPTLAYNPSANEYLPIWAANGLAVNLKLEIFGRRLAGPALLADGPPPGGPVPGGSASGGGKPLQRPAGRCAGKAATKTGTNRADVIVGTARRDVIAALGGNDVVRGLGGNDLLCGGGGKDKLLGGAGNDNLRGEAGRDLLNGGPGKDSERQ
jgi:RTX calcium-binding nonapeptide repeat (4 copies)